jgi:hypothetical protein
MQNARGGLWPMEAKTLVVPTDSRWLAAELIGAGSEKMPYSADNTVNAVREGLSTVVWSRLTDEDCWFLLSAKAGSEGQKGHMLRCVMRLAPQFDRDNVFDSGDRRYKGRFRAGFGLPDWRGIDGCVGA